MLTDTHAHLDYPEFEQDLPAILERANAAGVTRVLSIGTSLESSRRAVALAERYPNIHAVIGVHPTSAHEAEPDVVVHLRELAKNPRVVALGEIGLDFYRMPGGQNTRDVQNARGGDIIPDVQDRSGGDAIPGVQDIRNDLPTKSVPTRSIPTTQATLFEAQLDLAAELGLNVVIHQRAAWDETLEILRPYTGKLRAVYHCFGNPIEQAQELFSLNHIISFTGIITFKNAAIAQASATQAPVGSFMVETDCPYLAPVPFRGKRCEPAHTRLVAEKMAQLRGVSIEEIADQTTRTANSFFRFQPR